MIQFGIQIAPSIFGYFISEKKNIEEENKNATPAEKYSINKDALVKELGPERRGKVRGLGFGAKPSHMGA